MLMNDRYKMDDEDQTYVVTTDKDKTFFTGRTAFLDEIMPRNRRERRRFEKLGQR